MAHAYNPSSSKAGVGGTALSVKDQSKEPETPI